MLNMPRITAVIRAVMNLLCTEGLRSPMWTGQLIERGGLVSALVIVRFICARNTVMLAALVVISMYDESQLTQRNRGKGMMTPDQIGEQLNRYEADNADDDFDHGPNIWEDLIFRLPGYDEIATQEIDPAYYSDQFVVNIDGRQVAFRYDYPDRRWKW